LLGDKMAQAESKLSRKIMTALRARGWFCFKVHGSEFMLAGLPDIICCAQGLFIGLETKMPGKEKNTSARQDYVHELIQMAGGKAIVVSSVAAALEAVEQALRDAGKL
jgi:Holliday junction resolvase